MLGSVVDADDAVQETMVRAWRGISDFEGRSALRSWLYRIATNVCLDQLSGRMLGVRADIAPQVARIDAHLLNRTGVTRLCYAGSVLHTLPNGMSRTREPLQIGAEIYGHSGIESDVEIQCT